MIRTPLGTTRVARSVRCVLLAATLAVTTALIGGMVEGPAAALATSNWHTPNPLTGQWHTPTPLNGGWHETSPLGGGWHTPIPLHTGWNRSPLNGLWH